MKCTYVCCVHTHLRICILPCPIKIYIYINNIHIIIFFFFSNISLQLSLSQAKAIWKSITSIFFGMSDSSLFILVSCHCRFSLIYSPPFYQSAYSILFFSLIASFQCCPFIFLFRNAIISDAVSIHIFAVYSITDYYILTLVSSLGCWFCQMESMSSFSPLCQLL